MNKRENTFAKLLFLVSMTTIAGGSGAAEKRHNPENVATRCVHVVFVAGRDRFRNDCPWPVSVSWPGGIVNLNKPGDMYPTMEEGKFSFFACRHDPQGTAGMSRGNICHD